MRISTAFCALALCLVAIPSNSVSAGSKLARAQYVPAFAESLTSGHADAFKRQFAVVYKIETYHFGERIEVSIDDMLEKFIGCNYVEGEALPISVVYASKLYFDCGDDFNYIIETVGADNNISAALYYADTIAMPRPKTQDGGAAQ